MRPIVIRGRRLHLAACLGTDGSRRSKRKHEDATMASLFAATLALALALGTRSAYGSDPYHPHTDQRTRLSFGSAEELDAEHWYAEAAAGIGAKEARGSGEPGGARNVVLFLGDGMSVPTLAAARALLGQRRGLAGEEAQLSFEAFPSLGLAKTYCVDSQVADSACSATAYLCGAKANYGTLGVSARVPRGHCWAAAEPAHRVASIAEWALASGRDAGLVTTARVTHASPGGLFAQSSERDWESDADVRAACPDGGQADIALQLVHSQPGSRFKVILGGGRREFLPETVVDEEGASGRRLDGRNLIEEWRADKVARNVSHEYVWNREQLVNTSEPLPDYLLGLFEGGHMRYHLQADPRTEPTLAELTETAIRMLSRNPRGFFLFVEGGRIDHAHHDNLAQLALDETIELAAAVERASELLSEEDSLLVVTADHAHVMSFNGYPRRGADILGASGGLGSDGVPYMTLSYANGPGYRPHDESGVRVDVTQNDYHDVEFAFPASVPLVSETHGGDDVAVFARGPSHGMFSGLYEQSQIPHLMGYAACLGPVASRSRSCGGR